MAFWRRGRAALLALGLGAAAALSPGTSAAQSGGFICTEVIGYSQTRQWFYGGFQSVARNGQWQIRGVDGASVDNWAKPDFNGWDNANIGARCAQGSDAPDRVVLDISDDYHTDVDWWVTQARIAINNIHQKRPSARQIVLQPVVGGPGGAQCPFPNGKINRASFNHPYINQAIDRLVAGGGVARGPDPTVRTCADYIDDIGHLVPGADQAVGASIAQFWTAGGAAAPPPPPVFAPPPPAENATDAFCALDEDPSFNFGFLSLSEAIGPAMGGPMECEHGNPDNGDTLQLTSTGLAFYRASTNTPTFTDGFQHWAITPLGLVTWTGTNIDPP